MCIGLKFKKKEEDEEFNSVSVEKSSIISFYEVAILLEVKHGSFLLNIMWYFSKHRALNFFLCDCYVISELYS